MSSRKKQKKKYKIKEENDIKRNNRHKKNLYTEIASILVLVIGILVFIGYYIDDAIGVFGTFVRRFLLGLLGIPSFFVPVLLIIYALLLLFRKDKEYLKSKAVYIAILLVLVAAIFHSGTYDYNYYKGRTIIDCLIVFYRDGQKFSGGGLIGGIIALPLLYVFQVLGTIIILASLSLIDIILLTDISIYEIFKKLFASFTRGMSKFIKGLRESMRERGSRAEDENEDENNDITINMNGIRINSENNHLNKTQSSDEEQPLDEMKIIDFQERKKTASIKTNAKNGRAQTNLNDAQGSQNLQNVQGIKDMKNDNDDDNDTINSELQDSKKEKVREIFYKYPPADLLNGNTDNGKNARTYRNTVLEGAKKLEETLKSFGVEAKVINVTIGPSVTRYELQPSAGVKVSRIVNLADDISLNMAASGVRIEAPIPGKAAVGIEIANKEVTPVLLREVIESKEFSKHPSKVAFAVGKDISGECIVADIEKMPHLLIAGATGSGKSVCINTLIMSILFKASPDEVKLLMIDPKVVELGIYNGIPHLLIPVVTDPKKAAGALNWAVQEMVNRYKMFAEKGVRDIKGYNAAVSQSGEQSLLPQILIIIDELSDLMMVAPGDVEDAICRLAQMARAAGMHLIIATQRPSVDVITGLIKANIPSRISFAVSSQIDSRTILDMAGAEKLLGRGDMLFYPTGQQKPIRVQGAFVSEKEIERVVEFIKSQSDSQYDSSIIEEIDSKVSDDENGTEDECDELLPQAIELVIEAGQASASLLQRRFKVGYARAARMIDQMEARGIIGGFEGSKPRQVLITRQQWQEMKMSEGIK